MQPIEIGSRWRDKVENFRYTVLLLPRRVTTSGEGSCMILALGEDGIPRVFTPDYWHEDFEPDGKPEGQKFMIPAQAPL